MANTNALQDKVNSIKAQMNDALIERDEFIDGCMLAVLSQKNLFVIGTPGTAKSMAVEMLNNKVTDSSYFEYLLGNFTKPEELFGPYDIPLLKQGQYKRITEDRLPTANFGFLDEIWKGNSSILNDLLRISDGTRRFYNPKPERTPLMSLFGASNELPQEDILNALYDRFQLRFVVKDIADSDNFISMLNPPKPPKHETTITMDELKQAQAEVQAVTIPDSMYEVISSLRNQLNDNGFSFSPRRWRESLDILKAHAWMNGRNEVTADDIVVYCDILWNKPEERKDVCKIVMATTNPEMTKALELMDTAQQVYDEAIKANTTAAGHEAIDKLKTIAKELTVLRQSSRVKDISTKVAAMKRDVYDKVIDL